ncbi:hypothetical protein [Kitasatospora sp. NPDC059800]|uniref:hypothetical protein n=1 Tax=Kitasatospora sp. NPDC059800 TaxID=3346951 RepID=UPI003657E3C6
MAAVSDPRRAGGRRRPLHLVLALAACTVPAGAKSPAAIEEWPPARHPPTPPLSAAGSAIRPPPPRPKPPSAESCIASTRLGAPDLRHAVTG